MASDATIRRVARPRGELTEKRIHLLWHLRGAVEQAEADYRETVVRTLEEGGSFAEVSKATGLSTNTLQRWKREANDAH